jgi:hypothetical protein
LEVVVKTKVRKRHLGKCGVVGMEVVNGVVKKPGNRRTLGSINKLWRSIGLDVKHEVRCGGKVGRETVKSAIRKLALIKPGVANIQMAWHGSFLECQVGFLPGNNSQHGGHSEQLQSKE